MDERRRMGMDSLRAVCHNTWLCGSLHIQWENIILRKAGFFGGFIMLFVFAYVLVIASGTASAYDDHSRAVVVVPTANMATTPGVSTSKMRK